MSFDAGAPAFWFVEVFLDGETLRHCNADLAITFDGQTYSPLGDRLTPPRDIDRAANLKAQKFSLTYDSSQQTVDTDVVGKILDAQWKRRKIRVRYAVGDVGASGYDFSSPFIIADEAGRIKNLSDKIAAGDSPALELEVESGALIFLERRNQTRSPANQKAAFPGDAFFDLAARLDGVVLPWRTKRARNGTVQIQYEVDGVAPRQMLIGRGLTRGSFVFGCTVGQQRKFWDQVYALADHRCEALEKLFVNGVDVLAGESALVHGTKKALAALNSGGTRLWVTWYDGREDQTADAYLISETASQPLKWTSAHRGRGVSYVIIEHAWDSDNPESFSYEFQLKGARVYQEQKDTTAGGSGSHRLATPSTWEWTTNPEEALRHYLRGRVVSASSSYSWFGVGAASDFIDPYAAHAYRAGHCDDLVALKLGGTHKRYEANGWISAADSHAKNIQKLADCMVADPVDEGGRVSIRLSEPQTPVVALYDTDLVDDEETAIEVNARGDDVINRVEGRYQDPNNKYAAVDYPPISSATFETIDGDEIEGTWNQELETSEERAQRKATLYLNKQRRTIELEEHFGTKAKDVRPGDWLTRYSSLRGFPAGKLFIADEVRRFVDGTVRLLLLEVDPAEIVWNEADAQLTDIGDGPAMIENQTLDVPSVTVTAITVTGGDVTIPAVRFAIATYDSFMGDEIECEFGIWNGLSGGSAGIAGPVDVLKMPGNFTTFDGLKGLLPGTGYAFRFRARDGEAFSAWSTFRTLTTTGTYQAGRSAIADSIVGQGWGATAPESAISNALVPFGVNGLSNSGFVAGAAGWKEAWNGTAGVTIYRSANDAAWRGAVQVAYAFSDATPAAGTVFDVWQRNGDTAALARRNLLPVLPGDKVYASALLAKLYATSIYLVIGWYNSSGVYITELGAGSVTADSNPVGGVSANMTRVGGFGIAPANAAFANVWARVECSGAFSPLGFMSEVMLSRVPAGQTAAVPYSPGSADLLADPTIDNTAAAIAGQGAFATVNTAGYGSALLTGFGTLAPLGFTTLGTNVRRADGATAVTDATAITALGTAAAITGQGSFATLSAINDTLANANNLLRRSAGGLFSGDLAATVGARAGTNLFRTDGFTILTQADVRTPEGTAAAIAGQGAFATVSSAAYGSALLTGFGGLSPLNFTTLGAGGLVRRQDGVTALTDDAAVTSLGTAAAIAGQDWGATASEAAASNVRVPIGVNQIVDHDFRFGTTYWRHTPQSGSVSYADATTAGVKRRTLTGAGVTIGHYIQIDSFPDRTRFACKAGDLVEASAYVSAANCSDARVFIQFYTAANATAGFSDGTGFAPGSSTAELSSFVRGSVLAVAPASTAYAIINVRGNASTSAPVLHVAKPMLAIANSGQTVPSAWNPGLAYTPGADPTGANTAAAITGQGWGATAAQFAADNQYSLLRMPSGLARNANFAEPFSGTARPPGWSEWVDGLGTFGALAGLSGSGYKATVPASQIYHGIQQRVPAFAGQTYLLACEARRSSGSFAPAGAYVSWRNASEVELGVVTLQFGSEANTAGIITSTPDGFNRWEKLLTPPAGTVSALFYAMNAASFFGSVASGTGIEWKLCDLIPLTLVSQLGANVTGLNTAAAIIGQGALATLNTANTAQIASGAVSNVTAAYTAGTTGGTAVGDGWTRQQSVTLTSAGGVLVINAAIKGVIASDTAYASQSVRIRRGATTLYEAAPFVQVVTSADAVTPFSATITDTPAAGTYTYYIETTFSGAEISRNEISNRTLVITELKR